MVEKSKTVSTKSMDHLSNAFSLLEMDVEDDRIETTSSANDPEKPNGEAKKETDSHKNVLEGDYRLPLVWIDLEMTGLNIEVDRILEIACIITDGKLNKSIEGPDLVIHQPKKCLDEMGEWCTEHHAASGLTEKVIQSTISEKEAEQRVVEFVKKHVGTYTPLLAGNSVYVDFMFLKKYMPELASLFSHVVVDVSSINALCVRWFPRDKKKAPKKEKNHRAMDDIKESIAELKYYKENVFKSLKSKK
ncbi:putative oligonucleotidase [Helianthus debilis subsp. tardiflorus]